MRQAERYLDRLKDFVVSGPNVVGEYRMRCPVHGEDRRPSATANVNDEHGPLGVWHCNACGEGGSLKALVAKLSKNGTTSNGTNGRVEVASYDPFVDFDLEDAREQRQKSEPLSDAKVRSWHEDLMSSKRTLRAFREARGLTVSVIRKRKIGYEQRSKRFTIPVYDENGLLVNVRRYLMGGATGQKMWNAPGHGSPPRIYPIDNMSGKDILIVEGELDALIAQQHGFSAVSGTGGAKRWDAKWSPLFEGKVVYLCYDNDKEGRIGMRKAARSLLRYAESVYILDPIVQEPKGDITDFFLAGGTARELRKAMGNARLFGEGSEEAVEEAEPTSVQVIGSMDSSTNGKPLEMSVTIVGKKNPTYSVPKRIELTCTMDAGPRCKNCPMQNEWEGEHVATLGRTEIKTLSRFIDATETQTLEVVRRYIGAEKCQKLRAKEIENQTVEEIFVMSDIDRQGDDDTDYTQRRIYNIGGFDTRTNTAASVVGTTIPNPKDRRNEFFSWELREAITSIDTFDTTKAVRDRLSIFQPSAGQTPLDKCFEIARDLSHNVTKIIGRDRMHIAMDLVWHSLLHFPLDGKTISRGWLEFLVVGDTRTGKSETAIRLSDHYQLGHVIGCEGATFAGLVGGAKQVGNSWTISWGEITLNDRRLVVLDEASGLHTEIIAQLSDVRSRGIAQITKIETQQTRARARMIWISNPRPSVGVNEKKTDGIDMIQNLIGNPEDIARFDFAMSVSMNDVPSSVINSPTRRRVRHVYTSELCRDLILWAWSRRADQVVWREEAYEDVYKMAEKIGARYVDSPPLIQRTNVREKIARLSVALAARTFSTDSTGELLVIEQAHVRDAVRFLDRIYSYDNFGYLRVSNRVIRNRQIARRSRRKARKFLQEHDRLLEFLLDRRGSFRSQDLEEMAQMGRDEVNYVLGVLSEWKMVTKDKSQIVVEPELHELLKEIEDE